MYIGKWTCVLPVIGVLAAIQSSNALAQTASRTVIFKSVRVFDGKGTPLSDPQSVIVVGNRIGRIARDGAPSEANGSNVTVIEGGGRTLMPGLIDAHAHLSFNTTPFALSATADSGFLQIRSAMGAEKMLLSGFTSVRDVSGPVFGMKRAIDEGIIRGPRIWPSGPMISQTSGHADNRTIGDLPSTINRQPHPSVRFGYVAVADGVTEVHKVSRDSDARRQPDQAGSRRWRQLEF
jgi:imidazolonepropionase-like amidohydrolase